MKRTFRAKSDESGKLKIFNSLEFSEVLKLNSGKDILISIEVPEAGGTVYQMAYFKNVICARFLEVFRKEYGEHANIEIVANRLLDWSPFGIDSEGKERKITELSVKEFSDFIDHCKMIASREFDLVINE